jgi:hypothetical protein
VLSFGVLVYYSHRVARSIQNPDMIGAIVPCAKSGYLQHVDHSALVASIVLARILLGVVLAGSVSGQLIAKGVISFVVMFVGGLAVGWLLGLLTGYALGRVEDRFIESHSRRFSHTRRIYSPNRCCMSAA